MPLSYYLKTYTLAEAPGQRLLFSTRRTALALLPEAEFAAVAQGQGSPRTLAQLASLGMVVPDLEQEQAEVHGFYAEQNRISRTLTVALVLGMECNFACRYCYQGTLKGGQAMSTATAEVAIAFIKGRFRPGMQRLQLNFYGGETLLYHQRLLSMARELQAFAEARGARFAFTVVSNGSLLTPRLVEQLTARGMTGIKVTIDGPAANHNHFRPFKNGRPSYQTIVANLKAVSGLTTITLGGNFTQENYHLFPQLLDDLTASGLGPERISRVSFAMVVAINDPFAAPGFHGGCTGSHEPWLVEATLLLRGAAMARGYKVAPLRPEVCAVEIDDAFAINYDGSLYHCLPLAGREQFKAGDVWQGFGAPQANLHLDNWREQPDCPACPYLPLCHGGCRFTTYQRTGAMAGVDCQREYFDCTLPEMLRQDLRYRHGLTVPSKSQSYVIPAGC